MRVRSDGLLLLMLLLLLLERLLFGLPLAPAPNGTGSTHGAHSIAAANVTAIAAAAAEDRRLKGADLPAVRVYRHGEQRFGDRRDARPGGAAAARRHELVQAAGRQHLASRQKQTKVERI
jgi:hypothetical protein